MSLIHTNLKLAFVLALTLLGPAACNNQKAEQVEDEDEAGETQSDATPTRDNRNSQSGDAAFIKIFPDGDVTPTRGEAATVSAPAAESKTSPISTETSAPAPASALEDNTAAAPAPTTPESPVEETSTPAQEPVAINEPTPPAEPVVIAEPAPVVINEPAPAPGVINEPAPVVTQPAPAPVVINEPAPAPAPVVTQPAPVPVVTQPAPLPAPVVTQPAPAPAPVVTQPAPAPVLADETDHSRPVVAVNESTASQIISVLPKENKAIVAIGKHADFVPGPYMILAKWNQDSKKVKVNVTSEEAKEKNCAIDSSSEGEWKTLGVFFLTKNAKVVITNGKNSTYAVKNELMLKPVIADNLTSPSKFKCLDGQIDGQGLVEFH